MKKSKHFPNPDILYSLSLLCIIIYLFSSHFLYVVILSPNSLFSYFFRHIFIPVNNKSFLLLYLDNIKIVQFGQVTAGEVSNARKQNFFGANEQMIYLIKFNRNNKAWRRSIPHGRNPVFFTAGKQIKRDRVYIFAGFICCSGPTLLLFIYIYLPNLIIFLYALHRLKSYFCFMLLGLANPPRSRRACAAVARKLLIQKSTGQS